MDKDKTMTKNSRACGRVQGMLGGGGIDRSECNLCAGGFKKQSKKDGMGPAFGGLEGRSEVLIYSLEVSSPDQTWTSSCSGLQGSGNSVMFRKP